MVGVDKRGYDEIVSAEWPTVSGSEQRLLKTEQNGRLLSVEQTQQMQASMEPF